MCHVWELLSPQSACQCLVVSKANPCGRGAEGEPSPSASLRRLGPHHLAASCAGSGTPQGSQALQRLSRCDCDAFRPGPQAVSSSQQVKRACSGRESEAHPRPTVGDLRGVSGTVLPALMGSK